MLTEAAAACFRVADGGTYLVSAQLAGAGLAAGRHAALVGTPSAPVAMSASARVTSATDEAGATSASDQPAQQLHARHRAVERALSGRAAAAARAARAAGRSGSVALRTLPTVGDVETFSVLATLDLPSRYTGVRARARFVGRDVIVFSDTAADEAFTSAQWDAFGRLFDETLFPAAVASFGTTSDLDGNGRTIVLFTPRVNALVTQLQCAQSGFVNGFFNPDDLAPGTAGGNAGEVFYAYVPDPTGRWSCPHGTPEVQGTIPPTFIHELQHMISFQQHVLVRGGAPETLWLNEGLSHIAEELGARLYEARFPPPSGRLNTTRLWPDSAVPYMLPNLSNASQFLTFPSGTSVSAPAADSPGTFEERGAAWLLLRWAGGQFGDPVFRRLVETRATGTANLEAATGRPWPGLLGDFAAALWADSLVGVARAPATGRWRFGDRNLRRLFADFRQVDPVRAVREFPLVPIPIVDGGRRTLSLPAGGMALFRWTPQGGALGWLRRADATPFPSTFGAQVVLFREP